MYGDINVIMFWRMASGVGRPYVVAERHGVVPSDGGWGCLGGDLECVVDVCVEHIIHRTVDVLCREVVVLLNIVQRHDVHGLLTRIWFRRGAIRFQPGREFWYN